MRWRAIMEIKEKTKTTYRSGLFEDKDSADAAYKAAISRGYSPEEITVIMSDDTRKKYYGSTATKTTTATGDTVVKTETGDKSMEGLALGGALGGTVLGVIGAVIALSSTIVIPGIGLVVAGPLAAGLVGAGAGSIAGGLIGALVGAGIPEEHAKIYEKGIKSGGIVVSVPARDKDNLLIEDWKKTHGRDIF